MNEPITRTKRKERKTKIERTIHENETNEKRKRYDILVNLNDPESVRRCFKGLVYGVQRHLNAHI